MSQEKYIGIDVHQATISVAVMDAGGKLIMECLLETKASTIVEFIPRSRRALIASDHLPLVAEFQMKSG